MTKLTLRALQRLANEPGRHPDGVGLFLRVKDADHRFWTYRYRLGGKETELSLGPYPKVGLDEARRLHAKARAEVVNGIDPRAGKKFARGAKAAQDAHTPASAKPTFGAMADLYIDTHEASWRNPKHRQQWSSTLRDYCAPIRSVPVDQIDTQAILGCLRPIWTLKPETASRVRGRIETILNAARALGFTDENRANPARWRGHLDQLLPKQPALSRGNHAALPYGEVPAFMARLKDAPGAAAKALAFLILTAARSGEILGARWDELDEAAAVWTVPAGRMKAGKAHRVPLSAPALAILAELRAARRNDHPFVFPGQRPRKPLSNMAGNDHAAARRGRIHATRDAKRFQRLGDRGRAGRICDGRTLPRARGRQRRGAGLRPERPARTAPSGDDPLGAICPAAAFRQRDRASQDRSLKHGPHRHQRRAFKAIAGRSRSAAWATRPRRTSGASAKSGLRTPWRIGAGRDAGRSHARPDRRRADRRGAYPRVEHADPPRPEVPARSGRRRSSRSPARPVTKPSQRHDEVHLPVQPASSSGASVSLCHSLTARRYRAAY
jgi:integrase